MAGVALIIVNFIPLEAIATMGSAGFLIFFMAVNIANVRLAKETRRHPLFSSVAAIATALSLVSLFLEMEEIPATRSHIWILVGMIVLSLVIELHYRARTGRRFQLVKPAMQLAPE